MPAPLENQNRTTHGVRGYLAIGSFPKGASYIRRTLGTLREQLETTVATADGEITLYKAALIQSACRHEGRALLLGRWLRIEKDLPLSDRLALVKGVGDATDSRDRCLKLLELDIVKTNDIWAGVFDAPLPASVAPAPTADESIVTAPNASNAIVGDSAGCTGVSNGQAASVSNLVGIQRSEQA